MLDSRRITVVDNAGSGKTTLALALGHRLGLLVIHLDEHYWRPGWVETPRAEWVETHRQLIAGDDWIIDGNYRTEFGLALLGPILRPAAIRVGGLVARQVGARLLHPPPRAIPATADRSDW